MARFPTTLSLLSFLIILLHTSLLAYSQAVLDINGDFVRPGVDYFILPSARGTIGLSSAPNRTCPLDVVLQTNRTDNALPVKFSPKNSKDIFFNTGTDVNIEFDASTICVTSTVWRIQPSVSTNQSGTRYFVTIGGVIRNPSSWFRIESSELGGYVINFCPTVCNTCRPVCGNIGLILENGRTRLGITSPPLQVSFVPSPSSAVAPSTGL